MIVAGGAPDDTSEPPTGPAGGSLAGTYPNPTFNLNNTTDSVTWTQVQTFETSDAGATVTVPAIIAHLSSASAANIGSGIKFQSSNSLNSNLVDVAQVQGVLTANANGAEAGALDVLTRTGGAALRSTVRAWGSGGASFGTAQVATDPGNGQIIILRANFADTNRAIIGSGANNDLTFANGITSAGSVAAFEFETNRALNGATPSWRLWSYRGTLTNGRQWSVGDGAAFTEKAYVDFSGALGNTFIDGGATVVLGYTLGHQSSASAANIGVAIKFQASNSLNSNLVDVAQVQGVLTNNTNLSEAGALDVLTRTGGAALTTVARFWGSGGLSIGTAVVGTDPANNGIIVGSNLYLADTNRNILGVSNQMRFTNSLVAATTFFDFECVGAATSSQARYRFWTTIATTGGRLLGVGDGAAYTEKFAVDFNGGLISTYIDTGAATVNGLILGHQSSASANFLGTAIRFQGSNNANNNLVDIARIQAQFTNNVNPNETTALVFDVRTSGSVLTSRMQLWGSGGLDLNGGNGQDPGAGNFAVGSADSTSVHNIYFQFAAATRYQIWTSSASVFTYGNVSFNMNLTFSSTGTFGTSTQNIQTLSNGQTIFGSGDGGASPVAFLFRGPNAAGANIAGSTWTFQAPLPTGNAVENFISLQGSVGVAAGSSQHTARESLRVFGNYVQEKGGHAQNRTTVADAAYTALVTDKVIAYTSLTLARVITGPTAGSGQTLPTGLEYDIVDEGGNSTPTKTLTFTPAAGTIDGAASKVMVFSPFGRATVYFDGANWHTRSASVAFSQPTFAGQLTATAATTVTEFLADKLITDEAGATAPGNVIPIACTACALYVNVAQNSTTTATTYTVMKNGATTLLKVSVGAGATGVFSDLVDVPTFAVSDKLDLQVSNNSGGLNNTIRASATLLLVQ